MIPSWCNSAIMSSSRDFWNFVYKNNLLYFLGGPLNKIREGYNDWLFLMIENWTLMSLMIFFEIKFGGGWAASNFGDTTNFTVTPRN